MGTLRFNPGNFTELTWSVLFALQNHSMSGRLLLESLAQNNNLTIEPGTLFQVLAHLERQRWIESDEISGNYRITTEGIEVLSQRHMDRNSYRERIRPEKHPLHMEKIMKLILFWIVRLYPVIWRERYEIEMVALLEQHTLTIFTFIDLLVGVLDARLDPHYRTRTPLSSFMYLRRIRTSYGLIFSTMAAFLLLFYWNGLDFPLLKLIDINHAWVWLYRFVMLGRICIFSAIPLTIVLISFSVIQQQHSRRHKGVLLFSMIAVMIVFVYKCLQTHFFQMGIVTPQMPMQMDLIFWFIPELLLILSPMIVALVGMKSNMNKKSWRVALLPVTLAVSGMAFVWSGVVTYLIIILIKSWTIGLSSEDWMAFWLPKVGLGLFAISIPLAIALWAFKRYSSSLFASPTLAEVAEQPLEQTMRG